MPITVSCSSWPKILSVVACFCIVFVSGCGPGTPSDTAHWQGSVTIAGSPVPDDATGSVTFRSQGSKGKAVTVPIENGLYNSPATPKGKVTVYVDLRQPTGESTFSERAGKEIPIMKDLVPPERMRGIELDVNEDKSDAHIEL